MNGPSAEGPVPPDIVAFLRARLDEDEAVAKAATPGPWEVNDPNYAERIDAADGTAVVAGARWGDEAAVFDNDEDARHIARHDPARVLREVEAKRRIVDNYVESKAEAEELLSRRVHSALVMAATATVGALYQVVQEHAAVHDQHPDYDPAWRPS